MSTSTRTLYDPATHPIAAAYVDANAAERHAARETWLASDEDRGYRLTVYRTVGLRHCDSVPRRRESPHLCRPSELRHRVYLWVRAIAAELEPQTATYWLICHAYPVHPRTGRADHGLLAEYILTVQPDTPPCYGPLPHDWNVIDPSVRECWRCGLRHEYREQASEEAPWPWQGYSRSEDVNDGLDVGDEMGYQGRIWRIVKITKEDGKDRLLTMELPGTSRTVAVTLADIIYSGEEDVDEEEQCSGTRA